MNFVEHYGSWAVIIGGSEGIGSEIAHQLAAKGVHLLLVARTRRKLADLKQALTSASPAVQVRILATDMSNVEGAQAVIDAAHNLEVGLLVYNAGACSEYRSFHAMDLEFSERLTTLNVHNMITLVHGFGRTMRMRRRGGILLMGSSASLAGMPGFAAYSAAKAFSSIFAEGVWHELRPYGVHVLGFMVSATQTPAIDRHFPVRSGIGDLPQDIAARALASLAEGPIVYAESAAARARELAAMPRSEAVEKMHEAAAIFDPGRRPDPA
jgi:short-subunit dehydrogenase